MGLTPVFETGIKTPFKQPIADNLSVIGCLVSFEIQVGQVLKVYASGNDSGSDGSTRKTTTYTVKSGDNLGSIAQRFGMTLSEIQSLNNISNPDKIQVGQVSSSAPMVVGGFPL
ncbi:LysM peptidoglycan-binding domain-containing protein [Bacillus subtilis]|uniref:LysM peptidoglycan-binding domain-containing protein n=1 Tax=Bacillus subtilis TaxID=1423 RepID=UPI002493B3D0|nr:LysM peptidoglycan-binding domain-containing protein [Bacillus subtilis]